MSDTVRVMEPFISKQVPNFFEREVVGAPEILPIDYLRDGGLRRVLKSIMSVNLQLKDPDKSVYLTDPGFIVRENYLDGLISRLGLDVNDTRVVYDLVEQLGHEIFSNFADLESEDISLRRVANIGYTAISEAQTFLSANKRTARAVYGRLRYGKSSEAIQKGLNSVLQIAVPDEIESVILQQNVTRIQDGIEWGYGGIGGIFVPDNIGLRIVSSQVELASYRDWSEEKSGEYKGYALFKMKIANIRNALYVGIGDKDIAHVLAGVLLQRDYGPAVWSCRRDESVSVESITLDEAKRLIDINTQLLQMRIVALLTGLANGGKFVNIVETTEGRKIKIIDWDLPEPEIL